MLESIPQSGNSDRKRHLAVLARTNRCSLTQRDVETNLRLTELRDVSVHLLTSSWDAPVSSRRLVRLLHDVTSRDRDDYVIEEVEAIEFVEHCVHKFFLAQTNDDFNNVCTQNILYNV